MNATECQVILNKVGLLFGKSFDKLASSAWCDEFKGLPPRTFDEAVRKAARSSTTGFFPSVGEVHRAIKEMTYKNEPVTPEGAFDIALRCFKWVVAEAGRTPKQAGELFELHKYPILRAVMNNAHVKAEMRRLAAPYNPRGTPITTDEAERIKRDFTFAYRAELQLQAKQIDEKVVDITTKRQLTAGEQKTLQLLEEG